MINIFIQLNLVTRRWNLLTQPQNLLSLGDQTQLFMNMCSHSQPQHMYKLYDFFFWMAGFPQFGSTSLIFPRNITQMR